MKVKQLLEELGEQRERNHELERENRRIRELVRIHRRAKWGLDGLMTNALGEVLDEEDRMLYESVFKDVPDEEDRALYQMLEEEQ